MYGCIYLGNPGSQSVVGARLMCFTKVQTQLFDNLMRPLEFKNLDRNLWNDKCDYYDLSKCTDFNPDGYN